MGCGYGWIAPTLLILRKNRTDHLTLTTEEASWIASLADLGRFVSPLLTILILKLFGRKIAFALCSIVFFIQWLVIALFSRSVSAIYFARLLYGMANGVTDVVASICLGENFLPHYRGVFGSIATASFYGGCVVEYGLVNYLSFVTVVYINGIVAFIVAISNIFASTETVPYLIMKGKTEKALKNFIWLRGEKVASKEVMQEFEELTHHVEVEKKKKLTISSFFRVPVYFITVFEVLIFCVLVKLTGSSPISNYSSIIFADGALTASEYTILFGVVQFSAAVFGSTVMERMRRRTILMISLLVIAITHACTAVLLFSHRRNQTFIPNFSWCLFTTITLYAVMYSSSILPIYYTFRSEILPQNVRSIGNAIGILGHSLTGFFIVKVFLIVTKDYGMYWNFVFYSAMSCLGLLFVYFVLPETGGMSLVEIGDDLEVRLSGTI